MAESFRFAPSGGIVLTGMTFQTGAGNDVLEVNGTVVENTVAENTVAENTVPENTVPEVMFSPGNGFPVQIYGALFSRVNFSSQVHALNVRGFGGSAVPSEFPGWEPLKADMRAYIAQNLSPPVILAGHSLGAMLCLQVAAEAPSLVSGLVLMEPIARGRRGDPWPTARLSDGRSLIGLTRMRKNRWPSREEAATFFATNKSYRDWHPEALEAFLSHGLIEAVGDGAGQGGLQLACPPWLEADFYALEPGELLFQWAERCQCPAVLMMGAESVVVHAEGMEDLTNAFGVGALLTLPGGHTFPMQHPLETARALSRALAMLRGEGGARAVNKSAESGYRP